ncbi:hypothetical protein [Deinococcus multiflagellatus]|uniref:Uncharacterized protein n=1 Tax=Deinococcus multiflagellatus TaxID=1656887 RepID=A0ABW1ZI72_9DEIO
MARLIERLSGAPAPLFSRRLFEATAGHPLFLLETLRDLRERGLLTERGGRWHTPLTPRRWITPRCPFPAVWPPPSRSG